MASPARPSELSPKKRRQILEGARGAFSEHGYEGASVDLVASRAGVSKATVYNHFQDKKALFIAAFSEEAQAQREELQGLLRGEPDGDLESALQGIGERLLRIMVSPSNLALHRHTMAQVCRFPEVGETLYARGPVTTYAALARYLQGWQARGALELDEPRTAAIHLVQLCKGELMLKAQLGVVERPSPRVLRATVKSAVRAFLRAYGS